MESKHGYLTAHQVRQLERMDLKCRRAKVRDSFLFCCYTGLRFSDLKTLRREHIEGGWISKEMVKTGYRVEVPITGIFKDKAAELLHRYQDDPELLTRGIGQNSAVNATLRELLEPLNLQFKATFHTSRHTFATLLLQSGTPMEAIQQMLGHRKIETTQIYGERDKQTLKKQLKLK